MTTTQMGFLLSRLFRRGGRCRHLLDLGIRAVLGEDQVRISAASDELVVYGFAPLEDILRLVDQEGRARVPPA